MLKADSHHIDMLKERDEMLATLAADVEAIQTRFGVDAVKRSTSDTVHTFTYPVTTYPTSVKSINLEKGPAEGKLMGIKGQYLIFDTGVVNIRRYTAYELSLRCP